MASKLTDMDYKPQNLNFGVLKHNLLFQLQLVSSQGCLVEQKTCYTDDKLQPDEKQEKEYHKLKRH